MENAPYSLCTGKQGQGQVQPCRGRVSSLEVPPAASDEFGCWCLGQLLALPLGWLEGAQGEAQGAQGLMVAQMCGFKEPHLVLNPGHGNLKTLTLSCSSLLCCS